jgi:hypothetical protein
MKKIIFEVSIVILPVRKYLKTYFVSSFIDQSSIVDIAIDPYSFKSKLFDDVLDRLQTL